MSTETTETNDGKMVPDLETFWYEPDPEDLRCLSCGLPFKDEALVRTFRVCPPISEQSPPSECSRVVKSHLDADILFFDRHLQCVLDQGVPVAAVSHVWDPKISAIQQRPRHSPQPIDVRLLATETPIRILGGVQDAGGDERHMEFWHDYFSVPQWTPSLKSRILLAIHTIFSTARVTVVHFDDLSPDVVEKLHRGATSRERLEGVTGVCNAAWFSRMWTAMEFVRSGTPIRMMTRDFRLVRGPPGDDAGFLGKVHEVWNAEVEAHGGDVFAVEEEVGMRRSENLVPWNLGPLREVRALGRANFAMAFALLSRRGCRDAFDFLHALRGVVGDASERRIGDDFRSEYVGTAWECLRAGDVSPLLITPAIEVFNPRLPPPVFRNYNDIWTWELGEQISPPSHLHDMSISPEEDAIDVRLQPVGIVTMVMELDWESHLSQFERCADMALNCTGPNLDAFVSTLCTRLYGEDKEAVMQHLENENLVDDVTEVLSSRYLTSGWNSDWRTWRIDKHGLQGEEACRWLADALCLTKIVDGLAQSRLALVFARYATIHCAAQAKVAVVTCTGCYETSLFRVGLFAPKMDVRRARAWRIPGLEYRMSRPGGMAILEKGGEVVGRMVWASPACACEETEMVRLKMPDLPNPRPHDKR
ncbi:hypothetical protein CkaCkLH20_03433 [Colletotrichum karsti]|uniref:Heterokaryon incompatibility domain-containing protein n=1 Tax=Colletotrichum karsti TaxID=1095194 RepID=A0A9P6IAX9_9PEZI|nr:uncharacterized protein CkaCkLH20_03433 [Colletotrichum karsti]KAF9879200.1 hypothetical protein CkaCkLH20_03433 [Colletotrichum karsti]